MSSHQNFSDFFEEHYLNHLEEAVAPAKYRYRNREISIYDYYDAFVQNASKAVGPKDHFLTPLVAWIFIYETDHIRAADHQVMRSQISDWTKEYFRRKDLNDENSPICIYADRYGYPPDEVYEVIMNYLNDFAGRHAFDEACAPLALGPVI